VNVGDHKISRVLLCHSDGLGQPVEQVDDGSTTQLKGVGVDSLLQRLQQFLALEGTNVNEDLDTVPKPRGVDLIEPGHVEEQELLRK